MTLRYPRNTLAASVFAALLLSAACAGVPAAYGPAGGNGAGFSEQRIETGRYNVTYTANDSATAETWALRRAAELTIAEGGQWFEVTGSTVDDRGGRRGPSTSVGIGVGGGSGRVSSGVGVGIGLPLGGSSTTTVSLGILIGRGDKPQGGAFYDAEDVMVNTAIPPR